MLDNHDTIRVSAVFSAVYFARPTSLDSFPEVLVRIFVAIASRFLLPISASDKKRSHLYTINSVYPMNSLLSRITQTPGQCGGRPCIRGMRIRVSDILEMLAENVSGER